jgi:hypothetical protein
LWDVVIRLVILVSLAVFAIAECAAGVGLAEWTIETPGKNRIADSDLFANQGVCLHRPAKAGGVLDNKAVCIPHIQWWIYFKGHVVGEAKQGFFLFDERSKKVQYFDSRANLDAGLKKLKLEKPLSKRLTPQDGWNIGVGLELIGAYQQQLKDMEAGGGGAQQLSPDERESLKKMTRQMLRKLQAQVAATTNKLPRISTPQ